VDPIDFNPDQGPPPAGLDQMFGKIGPEKFDKLFTELGEIMAGLDEGALRELLRAQAQIKRKEFDSYVDAGFTREEALTLLAHSKSAAGIVG
jgi:hypothetical protein